MNILYIGAFRFPDKDAAAARVLNNAKILQSLGHRVQFISWGGKYNESDLRADGLFEHEGFSYIITGDLDFSGSKFNKIKKYLHRADKSIKIIDCQKIRPDVIIAYNSDYWLSKKLLRYCDIHDIKLINDITEWYDYKEMPFFERPLYWYNMKYLQHRIKNKIVISARLDNYFKDSNNLLLPPLCDPKDSKWSLSINNDKLNEFDGVSLIYAGTPAKKDEIEIVVNAVDRLAKENINIRIIIIGITKADYLLRQPSNKNLHKNIIFIGRIPQSEVPAYYKKADFLVLMRKQTRKNNYGFPTKVAESMTAGVPVITNGTSDLSSFIKDGINGFLVESCTQSSIYDTLLTKVICLNRQTIDSIKIKAAEMGNQFNWRTYTEPTAEFLKRLRQ